uniref:Uncharacterized protein n=1 Tax=Arundo donax TaxID=35708 RepID=A0A0A9AVV2_ARUDO
MELGIQSWAILSSNILFCNDDGGFETKSSKGCTVSLYFEKHIRLLRVIFLRCTTEY